jgi:flagellar basal-body rod protein FlgG
MDSMHTAATGMMAQQLNMDVISNNLANLNTTGYKRSRAEFQDLVYQQRRAAGDATAEGVPSAVGLEVGVGTQPTAVMKMFSAGELQHTDNPMDVAIEGQGFFEVLLPDGRLGYTRDGSFKLDPSGRIVTSQGFPLSAELTVPPNSSNVTIGQDGTVSVSVKGSGTRTVGQIQLTGFVNPAGLEAAGHNLLIPTQASGEAQSGAPGVDGLGTLSQGYLEMSNVKVVEEMVKMIMAQRAYEMNGKAVQMSDEMLGMVGNMHR